MLTSRWFGGTPTTSLPYSRIWPLVGSSKPPIIRSIVVLPHPDGPSNEKNSPSPMIRSTPSTAATTPRREWKLFLILTSSIAGTPPTPSVEYEADRDAGLGSPSAPDDFRSSMDPTVSPLACGRSIADE